DASATPQPQSAPQQDWERGRSVPATQPDETLAHPGERRAGGSPWLWVPRVLLFLPRQILRWVILKPIEGLLYLIGKFEGPGTYQILPLAFYQTGFRASFGLLFVTGDLVGRNHGLALIASYGGKD